MTEDSFDEIIRKQNERIEEEKRLNREQVRSLLKCEENWLAGEHRNLYLECLGGKLLKDRKTDQEIRNGLILYHHVFGVCVKND
jgi:hypothetical protein